VSVKVCQRRYTGSGFRLDQNAIWSKVPDVLKGLHRGTKAESVCEERDAQQKQESARHGRQACGVSNSFRVIWVAVPFGRA
jgi:hypothetical protein